MFSGFDSFISVKYHHVYPVPKIFWNRYTQKMHNDNDTYYVQTTNTTIFFFISFFCFFFLGFFQKFLAFLRKGGDASSKRGHVNYQYLLAHMVSNIKLILILLFLFSVFYYPQYLFFLFFLFSYFSKWLCHFILWNVFNHFVLFLTS